MADNIRRYKSLFSTTTTASFSTGTGETITLASVVGLPTSTEITLTFNRVDSAGTATPTLMERIVGTISGSNFVIRTSPSSGRGFDSTTEQSHASGSVVEMIWNAADWNSMADVLTGVTNGATLKTPKVTTSINDANDNEVIKTPATASAVNEVTITNAATGNAPSISSTGGDTNIDLNLVTKGTGVLKVNGTSLNTATGADGWTASTDTWTYASASTFTIAGVDRTTTFTKGTRLKFTQTTAKYAVVVSSSFSTNTTVTIAVNTDYTIANAAITSPYYSYQASPQGYPTWFNFTPTFTGFSADPTGVFRFSITGSSCTVVYGTGAAGTSNGTGLTMTIPVAALAGAPTVTVVGRPYNNSTEGTAGQASISASGTTITCYNGASGATWTGSNGKFWEGQATYQF